jgi:hypothetical protein
MLRIVNIILVFTILTTQSAWAINDTALYQGDAEHSYAHAAEQHNETVDTCSHVNHAGVHFIGIFSNTTFNFPDNNSNHTSKLKNLASLISYKPPTPPPTF